MRRAISRGIVRCREQLKSAARPAGVRTRSLAAGVALVLVTGFLSAGFSSAAAQFGQGGAKNTGFPQRRKPLRTDQRQPQPANELTPDTQSGTAQTATPATTPQPQASPDERLIPRGIGPKQRFALLHVFSQLNLSNEQRAKLIQLNRETGNRMAVLNRLRQAQNEALEEALNGSDFDPKVVEQKASDLAATTTEIIRLQAKIMVQIRQIMTPEQAGKFRELLQEEMRRPAVGPLRQ